MIRVVLEGKTELTRDAGVAICGLCGRKAGTL